MIYYSCFLDAIFNLVDKFIININFEYCLINGLPNYVKNYTDHRFSILKIKTSNLIL